jgi:hypothetical protein
MNGKRRPQASRKDEETSGPTGQGADRKASQAYERERQRREPIKPAARQKERELRQRAVDKAQTALDDAEGRHAKRAASIQAEIEALEEKARAEPLVGTRKGGGWKLDLRLARD